MGPWHQGCCIGQDCFSACPPTPPPTLTGTDSNYVPVNTEPGPNNAVVDTNAAPLTFKVTIPDPGDGSDYSQIIEFELSDVSSLTGYATNACFKPPSGQQSPGCDSDLDTGPDFIFKQQAGFKAQPKRV